MRDIKELLREALSQKTCMKHPVGAVIVAADRISYVLGWNGAPSYGIEHKECSRRGYASGEGMHLCPGVHAERRAISKAAFSGISTQGGTIYMSEWFPCADCAKSIIEAGLEAIVTPDEPYENMGSHLLTPNLRNKAYNFEMSERLIREAGIRIIPDASIRV